MKQPTQMPPRGVEPEQGESAEHENGESGREEATEDGTQASPEEQAVYDMMVNQALDIIYPDDGSNKPRDQIVENLLQTMPSALAAEAVEGAHRCKLRHVEQHGACPQPALPVAAPVVKAHAGARVRRLGNQGGG